MEKWPWADRPISNRRKPRDSDRGSWTCHPVLCCTHILRKISQIPCRVWGCFCAFGVFFAFRASARNVLGRVNFVGLPHQNGNSRSAHRTPGRGGSLCIRRKPNEESPAKQRRDRDVRGTTHNPNELGRIRILLAGVSQNRGLHAYCARCTSIPHSP